MSEVYFLPPRLSVIAKMVGECRILADVGTDHAHLPVSMVRNVKCQKAFACDVNRGPLQRARETVEKNGLTPFVELILSDGLHQVPPLYDALVIAGMGGDLISRILYECPPVSSARLFLQPMTKPQVLRRFLFRHGYTILRECAVAEGEKSYIIFEAVCQPSPQFSEEDCYIPVNLECTPDALQYLEKLLNSHQRRLLGLRRAEVEDGDAIAFEQSVSEKLRSLWQTISRRLYDETH